MEMPREAVRIVKAMEKKDVSARGETQDFKVDDAVYVLVERNEHGQLTRASSVDGAMSVRRGSEGRIVRLPVDREDTVEVEFFEQGTGLFAKQELARTEGVEIDAEGLSKVLGLLQAMQRDLAGGELEVSIVAIMGKFRHGKSFLLNLLVQYFEWLELEWLQQTGVNDEGTLVSPGNGELSSVYHCGRVSGSGRCLPAGGAQCASCQRFQPKQEAGASPCAAPGSQRGWWQPEHQMPQSFKVQRQAETCTKGIEIFPRPFLLRRAGKQTAVLLMDSQGAFDGMINERQSQTILALTAVLASSVIYNFKGNIGEENLKHATDVANFVKAALGLAPADEGQGSGSGRGSPLGHLSFLLRDFDYPYADGQRDEDVGWEARLRAAEEDLGRFEDEVTMLRSSFSSVKLSWLCHPGSAVEQGRQPGDLRLGDIRPLFMQLLDEHLWHSFESGRLSFPLPSRSFFDGRPLTANSFEAYIEDLRSAVFDCNLRMAPPRWLATQLLRKECKEYQAHIEDLLTVSLPRIQLLATGGFGGYYTSDLDDYYSVNKLVQIKDRVISTSEKCPGSPTTGTVEGNVISMLGGAGVLSGDEIVWSSGESAGLFQLCGPPLAPQVWVRQALTKEQIAAGEKELQAQNEELRAAGAELLRLRHVAEEELERRVRGFHESAGHLFPVAKGELQGSVHELRSSLVEALDRRFLDARALATQGEAEAARLQGELAGQRERMAVLEAKMLKAELRHAKGEAGQPWPQQRPPREVPVGHRKWPGWLAACGVPGLGWCCAADTQDEFRIEAEKGCATE